MNKLALEDRSVIEDKMVKMSRSRKRQAKTLSDGDGVRWGGSSGPWPMQVTA